MKKVKVTFWLLGFGCGIALAGMIGTLLTLRIDLSVQQLNTKEDNVADEVREEKRNSIEAQGSKDDSLDTVLDDSIQDEVSDHQVMENDKGEFVRDDLMPISGMQQEVAINYYEVHIPNNSSASEICAILEEAGIVESGKDFLEYIKEHKKQTRLKNGTFKLPMYTDYDTLLALLLT